MLTDHRGVVGLRNLLPSMLSDQPVYALQAIDPAVPSWRNSSVEEIAAACLGGVRLHQPHGPYRLGGHSLGGLVAFEMACALRRAGEPVELLILLDTLAPEAFRWRGRIAARDRTLRESSTLRRAHGQAGLVRAAILNAAALARGERRLRPWPRGFDDPWDQAGADRLGRLYRPRKLDAPLTVLNTAASRTAAGSSELGWGRHASGPVAARAIPGEHESIFNEPHVQALTSTIARELAALESAEPKAMEQRRRGA